MNTGIQAVESILTCLLRKAAEYLSAEQCAELERACRFAILAHAGRTRDSGAPFIVHPLAVALALVHYGRPDIYTLIACVLHDIVEDTHYALSDIRELFGDTVAVLVDGLTKLEDKAATHKKILAASTTDSRVILIKLFDRDHNLSTLAGIPDKAKRLRIAKETLDFYVPLAREHGFDQLASDLARRSIIHLST